MEFRTINNCGKLGFDFSIGDGVEKIIVKYFLENLIQNIVKRSKNYFYGSNEKDHIFGYKETQLHSVVCPSIADLTDYYVIEHPVMRKPRGEDEYSGHIDYWIHYRDYTILMELKHCYFAYNRSIPKEDISYKFNKSLEQLNDVKMETCRYLKENGDRGLIKIALQTIVFCQGSKNHISNKDLKVKDFEEKFDQLILKHNLNEYNFKSLWLLQDKLNKKVEVYEKYYALFPAVAFVGKVYDVIK